MSERVTAAEWEHAKTVCNPGQLHALDGWRKGMAYSAIGAVLGIHGDTAKNRVERAKQLAGVNDRVETVTTRCGRCGGSWDGTVDETRAAFAGHVCRPG